MFEVIERGVCDEAQPSLFDSVLLFKLSGHSPVHSATFAVSRYLESSSGPILNHKADHIVL